MPTFAEIFGRSEGPQVRTARSFADIISERDPRPVAPPNPILRDPEAPDDGFGLAEGAALASRTIFPTIGQLIGGIAGAPAAAVSGGTSVAGGVVVGGALGGAVGDILAQLIEKGAGNRPGGFNPALTAVETGLGAVPLGQIIRGSRVGGAVARATAGTAGRAIPLADDASRLAVVGREAANPRRARAVEGAIEGAAFGGAGSTLIPLVDGGDVTPEGVAAGVLGGGALGAAFGRALTGRIPDQALPKLDDSLTVAKEAAGDFPTIARSDLTIGRSRAAGTRRLRAPDDLSQVPKTKRKQVERLAGLIQAGKLQSKTAQKIIDNLGGQGFDAEQLANAYTARGKWVPFVKESTERLPSLGVQVDPDGKQSPFELVRNLKFMDDILQQLKDDPDASDELARIIGQNPPERISASVQRAVDSGVLGDQETAELLAASARSVRESASIAGRILNQSSQASQMLRSRLREADSALAGIGDAAQKANQTGWVRRIENYRRGLLVTQIATTARNIASQGVRLSIEPIDRALAALVKGEGFERAAKDFGIVSKSAFQEVGATAKAARQLFGEVRQAPKGERRTAFFEAIDTLASDRGDAAFLEFRKDEKTSALIRKLFNERIMGELDEDAVGGIVDKLNSFNKLQEGFFRRAAFDGAFKLELDRLGISYADAVAKPSVVPQEVWERSVRRSLELSFADVPDGVVAKTWLDIAAAGGPVITAITPFPRFLANSFKFLTDFNPGGVFKLLVKDQQGAFLGDDPAKAAQAMSRAMIGTVGIVAGIEARNELIAGEKWYELKPSPDSPIRMDMRPFAPFSNFMFIGEAIRQMAKTGEIQMENEDLLQGAFAMQRLSGVGLTLAQLLAPRPGQELDPEFVKKTLTDAVAQYLGSFSVPMRTVQDFLAGAGMDEEIQARDIRDDRLLGRFISNFPGLVRTLPQSVRSTAPLPAERERPILRQLTGLGTRTRTKPEQEIARLAISFRSTAPFTGLPEVDRMVSAEMAPQVDERLSRIIRQDSYARLDDEERSARLRKELARIKKGALGRVKARLRTENPKLRAQLDVELADRSDSTVRGIRRRRRAEQRLSDLFPDA